MTIDTIVNQLATAQQKLLAAPQTRTREVSEVLQSIFIRAMEAAISPKDREEIFSRWTYDYRTEDLNQVFQILLPYCSAQTIAWHSGADMWQREDKAVSIAKRMKPMNVYTTYSPNITVRRLVKINPEVAKKTAEILNTEGFTKEVARDLNYGLVYNLTIGEAQGSSSLCDKIVEHAIQTPSVLSPSYLRIQELVNRELSLELRYKRLGHAFSLSGMVALSNNKRACLEGASESFVFAMLRDTFDKFANARKDLVSSEMRDAISESLAKALWHDNATDEKINEIHRLIHDRRYPYPVCVSSGYVWHSTQVLFFSSQDEDFLAYCNRGAGCNQTPGVSICRIKHKEKITPEFLKRIASRLSVKQTEYTSLEKIEEELGAATFIYQPMKGQKSGHCVYSSAKAAILALFLVAASRKTSRMPIFFSRNALKHGRLIYKEFSKFDKTVVLEDFLIDIEGACRLSINDHADYLDGLDTLATGIRNWAIANKGRDKIDEDLLEKTLRLLCK